MSSLAILKCLGTEWVPNPGRACVFQDVDGNRMVSVEGFLSNTGDKALCNITVNVQVTTHRTHRSSDMDVDPHTATSGHDIMT
jgi:hypothetical protein